MKWTTTIIVVVLVFQTAWAPDCSYRYTVQPASIFTCNPYPFPTLTLRCAMDYFTDVPIIHVKWYGGLDINQNTPMELISQSANNFKYQITGISGVGFDPVNSRNIINFSTDLTITNLTDSDTGQYWCQVFLSNSSQLESSEEITLAPEETYTNDPECTSNQAPSLVGTICAMVLDSAEPVTTTTTLNRTPTRPSSVTTKSLRDQRTTESEKIDMTEFPSAEKNDRVIIAASTAVGGTLLLVSVLVGVCACIIVTRRCHKKRNEDSLKIQGKQSGARGRPLPPEPTPLTNGMSHRYDTPATLGFSNSYELESNPAYVPNTNEYLTIVEDTDKKHSGEIERSDREYAVADHDMERSDEPYYVYI